jgi:hypothetical protein
MESAAFGKFSGDLQDLRCGDLFPAGVRDDQHVSRGHAAPTLRPPSDASPRLPADAAGHTDARPPAPRLRANPPSLRKPGGPIPPRDHWASQIELFSYYYNNPFIARHKSWIHRFLVHEFAAFDPDDDGGLLGVAVGIERGLAGDAVQIFQGCEGIANLRSVR